MSRILQDSVIDDDEETCPLCIEEFDLSDKNFRPCPCGYQICQFCFNSLKTTYEKSTCPNCRRPYDEKTIQYKIPTAEEFKIDQQNKNRKQAAAKRKETEKREVETSSRRNLAGVRVKQTNLVYVIGLIPNLQDEASLLQTLRGKEYFGQYGDIEKIVVSKAKATSANQGIGVYVTYARREDAALCIQTVDGSMNGDRVLRAQFGTTKYCSAYLRGETCNNKTCSFLHESGEEGQAAAVLSEPNSKAAALVKPTLSSQTSQAQLPSRPPQPAFPITAFSQSMARQSSKDDPDSRKGSATDASALPTSASWANANVPGSKPHRASQAGRSTPSPQNADAFPASTAPEDNKPRETSMDMARSPVQAVGAVPNAAGPSRLTPPPGLTPPSKPQSPDPFAASKVMFERLLASVTSPNFRFVFDESAFSAEELAAIDQQSMLIDPYGGAKRRLMEDKEKAAQTERAAEIEVARRLQAEPSAQDIAEDEHIASGSFALGGEPEEDPRSASARGAIQRPSQTASVNNILNEQFQNLGIDGRSFTPQQRTSASGNVSRAPGLPQPNPDSALFDFDQRGLQFPTQSQYDPLHTHQRQNSRYFNNENKSTAAARFQNQQQSFYSSGVQGPPPGLPTAGTPPVTGGGMFAHGQGFTSNMNSGYGGLKDGSNEMHLRGRSGTTDTSKRGVVDHADPSILQARVHQPSTGVGQGLFGGNQVDEEDFPPLSSTADGSKTIQSRIFSSQNLQTSLGRTTPMVPPGLELPHSHPSPSGPQTAPALPALRRTSTATLAIPVLPAVPSLSVAQRAPTPKSNLKEGAADNLKGGRPREPVDITPQAFSASTSDCQEEISLGSPMLKNKIEKSVMRKTESRASTGTSTQTDEQAPAESGESPVKVSPAPKQPAMTEIPEPVVATPSLTAVGLKSTTPIIASAVVATPSAMTSPPTTPATAVSEASRASVPRPKTMRIITNNTTRTNDTGPASAATERSIGPPVASQIRYQTRSRADSLASASQSRPSTPAMSDRFSLNDVSRANSPPPSIVGSAPERTKTKTQQKKERKEKARKATGTADAPGTSGSMAAAMTSLADEVAPVVGRQRKQKKHAPASDKNAPAKSNATKKDDLGRVPAEERNDDLPTTQQESLKTTPATQGPSQHAELKGKESLKEDTKKPAAKLPSTTPTVRPPPQTSKSRQQQPRRAPYTLRDLYTDVAASPDDAKVLQKLLNERITSMSNIFASLLETDELDSSSALLNPQSFNSAAFKLPPDSRRGMEYLEGNGYTDNTPFGMIYLGPTEKRALIDGENFSIADENRPNDLLRRSLFTGEGTVYRHLSKEEEDKVVNLEARRKGYVKNWAACEDVDVVESLEPVDTNDFMNIGGGVDELIKFGERYGIGWYQEGDEDDDEDELEDDQDDDRTDDLDLSLDGVGSWEVSARALGTTPGLYPQSRTATSGNANAQTTVSDGASTVPVVNLRLLDAEKLQKRVAETQKEMEAARKEVEKMEKTWRIKSKEAGKWREGIAALRV